MPPGLFYPERGENPGPALAVCARCEVRTPCLMDALVRNEEEGIWGGTSGRQRKWMRHGMVRLGRVLQERSA